MVHEIENFYGVYLLYCTNPQYLGRTYVGFTVNPERRKKQHNRGKKFGGAWRTHGKRPWEMVLIIHGFPNMISALRFEWAWTKPSQSRRLKELPQKRNNESKYDYQLRVLWEMLRAGPWHRLPLSVRWLKQAYKRDFPSHLQPPMHMPVQHGPVKCVKVDGGQRREADESGVVVSGGGDAADAGCGICKLSTQQLHRLQCLACHRPFHTTCLAASFLTPPTCQLVPVEGTCPSCQSSLLWGDLVRFKRGCYRHLDSSSEAFSTWSKNLEDHFMH